MKKLSTIIVLFVTLLLSSCAMVQVATDYDRQANFSEYKTFGFFKEGIDKVPISDLDKRRILRAIEHNLTTKGMQTSENPDVLVNIFTQERENINVYNNNPYYWGWGVGYGPFWGHSNYSVSTNAEGTLFIEIIDAKKKELIWQGKGLGYIPRNMNAKEKAITRFVDKILEKYPPK
ncbi:MULTISPECIES: DUF4136 domain-containing protein [Capnocytophaga]|uniref:DUF4136 domain-containing protein n=1 Tax=Capnocytophaga TaxID=1016 RepID=UPI000BB19D17|nr:MULTISPECIES: DUF4136 domain-containing protein [Capnocytophaga]ATA73673.1 hypothetical protein CGC49_10555 [Capnocytophaga sp. H4358]ATA75820.1 hypothetical protein CGC52_10555 [Capnocytophaga sp. H2931]GIM60340.1 hypothetical protein CAPN008_03900 [Capnocytophaga canis]